MREQIHRCNNKLRADYEFEQSVRPVKSFLHRVGICPKPDTPTLNICDFPLDGLVIYMENGLPEYWAIRCNNLDDSPVYGLDYEGELVELRHRYDTVVDFLSSMLKHRLPVDESR